MQECQYYSLIQNYALGRVTKIHAIRQVLNLHIGSFLLYLKLATGFRFRWAGAATGSYVYTKQIRLALNSQTVLSIDHVLWHCFLLCSASRRTAVYDAFSQRKNLTSARLGLFLNQDEQKLRLDRPRKVCSLGFEGKSRLPRRPIKDCAYKVSKKSPSFSNRYTKLLTKMPPVMRNSSSVFRVRLVPVR